ncbi:MAG: hypothetical protein AABW73_01875 [Nanoarchaeota archaeon]
MILEQVVAMNSCARLGERIQQDFPEIAEMYRSGITAEFIARTIIMPHYGVSEDYARVGTQRALGGFKGSKDVKTYYGLIPKFEMRELEKAHKSDSGKRVVGERMREKVNMTQTLTNEELVRLGRIGGTKSLSEGLGIHDQSRIKEYIEAKGQARWTEEEKMYALERYEDERYKKTIIGHKRATDLDEVTKVVNYVFRGERTKATVATVVTRYKKERKKLLGEISRLVSSIINVTT